MSMDSEPMVTPEMERVILGFDHAQAGAALLENWKFPQVMTETIARQFEPSMDDPDPRMSYCLDFANDFGPSFRESEESANDFPVSEEFCSVSGLHQNEIRDAVAEAYVEFWELSKMLTE
jgi:HD-like signal output (HDOD) protein